MKSQRSLLSGLVLCAATLAGMPLGAVPEVQADPPPYLLLRTPRAPEPHGPTHDFYPGSGYEVHTQTYSYGWFGVRPRRHWSRHFGYYRHYIQWSAR